MKKTNPSLSKSDILSALVNLKSEDLIDVKTRIDFLLTTQSVKIIESSEDQLFYDCVADQMKKTSGISTISYFVFKRSKHHKKMIEAREFLDKQLVEIFEIPTKRQRVQFRMLYTRVILLYLDRYEIAKNISTIFNIYHKFSAELDRAFPGYGISGSYKMLFSGGE